jgi:hypothetical protein
MPLFDAYTINNTGLVNAVVQNVTVSPLNSSTAVLAPTGTFTGTGTLTLYDGVTTAAPSITIGAFDMAKVVGAFEFGIDFYNGLTSTNTRKDVMVVYE